MAPTPPTFSDVVTALGDLNLLALVFLGALVYFVPVAYRRLRR